MKIEVRKGILDSLKKYNSFEQDDFDIQEDKFGRISITYRYSDKNYIFYIVIPKKSENGTYRFTGTIRPGKYSDEETYELFDFDEILNKIVDWCKSLKADLFSVHENRRFDEMTKIISDLNTQFDEKAKNIEDAYLTKEEAEIIIAKLEEIEKIHAEHLEKEIEDKAKLKKELDEVKSEFTKLKQSTGFLKKKAWFKKCYNKLATWYMNTDKRVLLTNSLKVLGAGSKLIGIDTGIVMPEELEEIIPTDILSVIPDNIIETSESN